MSQFLCWKNKKTRPNIKLGRVNSRYHLNWARAPLGTGNGRSRPTLLTFRLALTSYNHRVWLGFTATPTFWKPPPMTLSFNMLPQLYHRFAKAQLFCVRVGSCGARARRLRGKVQLRFWCVSSGGARFHNFGQTRAKVIPPRFEPVRKPACQSQSRPVSRGCAKRRFGPGIQGRPGGNPELRISTGPVLYVRGQSFGARLDVMFVCLGLMAQPQDTFTTSAPQNLRRTSPHNCLHLPLIIFLFG